MKEISKKRYSRQRECIIEILKATDAHPTANMIYDEVRCEIPNISLGTVYRNLASLTEEGRIIKIESGDGAERYDIRVTPHSHLFCKRCKSVSDVFLDCDAELDALAEKVCGGKIETHNLVFEGICRKCIVEK